MELAFQYPSSGWWRAVLLQTLQRNQKKQRHAWDLGTNRSNKLRSGYSTQRFILAISIDVKTLIWLLRVKAHWYLQQVSNVFNFTERVDSLSSLLASQFTQCTSYGGILILAIWLKAVSYKRPLTQLLLHVGPQCQVCLSPALFPLLRRKAGSN